MRVEKIVYILLLCLFTFVKTRSKFSDFFFFFFYFFSVAATGFFFLTIVIFNLQFWEVKIVRLKTDKSYSCIFILHSIVEANNRIVK